MALSRVALLAVALGAGTLAIGCSGTESSDAATPEAKSIYTQEDCGDYGLTGFEVTEEALVVVNFDGPILRGKPSGADMEKIADLRIGTTAPFFDDIVLADGSLDVLSSRSLFDDSGHPIPQALYRVSIGDGAVTKVHDSARFRALLTASARWVSTRLLARSSVVEHFAAEGA